MTRVEPNHYSLGSLRKHFFTAHIPHESRKMLVIIDLHNRLESITKKLPTRTNNSPLVAYVPSLTLS